jgi:hypothetical protein
MRLHDITPRTTLFTTSYLAPETTGYNIMCQIFNFFSEFAGLRSSSTPSSQQPPPRKWLCMVRWGFMTWCPGQLHLRNHISLRRQRVPTWCVRFSASSMILLSGDQVPLLLLPNNGMLENNYAWSNEASWYDAQANFIYDTWWQTCTRWQIDIAVIPAFGQKLPKVIHLFNKDPPAFTRQVMSHNTWSICLILTSSCFHVCILDEC